MNELTRPETFATAEDWAEFFRPLVPAVSNPPSRGEYAAKITAIAYAMQGTPKSLLRQWRQAEAMRRFKFFPVPQEVAEWLGPELMEWRKANLRSSTPAIEQAPAERRGERTMEEILAVRATVQAFKAEMDGMRQPAGKPRVQPRHLSPGHLLAQYEALAAKGDTVAALRAQKIRAAMADAAEGKR